MACKNPIQNPNDKTQLVSCGHCIPCLIARSQEWAFRLEEEAKSAKSAYFITLTYADEFIPYSTDKETGEYVNTLDKTHVQKFMRALRQAQYGSRKIPKDYKQKIRYFFCGEYGPKTNRPHYHAIIFNLEKSVVNNIQKYWNKGFVKVGDCTAKSMRYVTNYMLLKNENVPKFVQKPFTTMSKKPILGANYVVNNYYHHHTSKDYKLKNASKHEKFLYRTLARKIFTKEELADIAQKKQKEVDKWKDEENKKAELKNPLDPLGHIKKTNQEQLKEIRRKAFHKLKKRKL